MGTSNTKLSHGQKLLIKGISSKRNATIDKAWEYPVVNNRIYKTPFYFHVLGLCLPFEHEYFKYFEKFFDTCLYDISEQPLYINIEFGYTSEPEVYLHEVKYRFLFHKKFPDKNISMKYSHRYDVFNVTLPLIKPTKEMTLLQYLLEITVNLKTICYQAYNKAYISFSTDDDVYQNVLKNVHLIINRLQNLADKTINYRHKVNKQNQQYINDAFSEQQIPTAKVIGYSNSYGDHSYDMNYHDQMAQYAEPSAPCKF